MNWTTKLSNPIHEQHCHPEGIRSGCPKDLSTKFTLELPKFADLFGTKFNAKRTSEELA